MVVRYVPDAGDLIKLSLDPRTGHEQAGWRPALVLTPATYNQKTGLAIVAPVTSQRKGYPFEVPLPEGLKITGVILADHVKNIDWKARNAHYFDAAPAAVLRDVQVRLATLLGLG
jgi:mRNA interferase MazF